MDAKKPVFLVIILAVTTVISGCATTMTQNDLLIKMQGPDIPVIVDVRSRGEYDRDHLPGAVHIPFYFIGPGVKRFNISKNKQIILYCEHGPRAGFAGVSLYFHGYDQVYCLEGHMKRWRENGLPTEKIAR